MDCMPGLLKDGNGCCQITGSDQQVIRVEGGKDEHTYLRFSEGRDESGNDADFREREGAVDL